MPELPVVVELGAGPEMALDAAAETSADCGTWTDEQKRCAEALARNPQFCEAIRRIAYTYGQPSEDLVQETIIRGGTHLIDPEADGKNAAPWGATVARRMAIDALRRSSNRHETPCDLHGPAVEAYHSAPTTPDIADGVANTQLAAIILGNPDLTAEHREALEAVCLQGLSIVEYGKVAGIPAGTAKSRYFYALRVAKQIASGQGITPQHQQAA